MLVFSLVKPRFLRFGRSALELKIAPKRLEEEEKTISKKLKRTKNKRDGHFGAQELQTESQEASHYIFKVVKEPQGAPKELRKTPTYLPRCSQEHPKGAQEGPETLSKPSSM